MFRMFCFGRVEGTWQAHVPAWLAVLLPHPVRVSGPLPQRQVRGECFVQKPPHPAFSVGFDVESLLSFPPPGPGHHQRGQKGPPSGLQGASLVCPAPLSVSPECRATRVSPGTWPGVKVYTTDPVRGLCVYLCNTT